MIDVGYRQSAFDPRSKGPLTIPNDDKKVTSAIGSRLSILDQSDLRLFLTILTKNDYFRTFSHFSAIP